MTCGCQVIEERSFAGQKHASGLRLWIGVMIAYALVVRGGCEGEDCGRRVPESSTHRA